MIRDVINSVIKEVYPNGLPNENKEEEIKTEEIKEEKIEEIKMEMKDENVDIKNNKIFQKIKNFRNSIIFLFKEEKAKTK